jgi:hypothetical protein
MKDQDPEQPSKSDPDPESKKIIPDPQHCNHSDLLKSLKSNLLQLPVPGIDFLSNKSEKEIK